MSGRPGLRSPADVLQIWEDEFDYLYHRISLDDRISTGVYVLTLHPQTTGKGSRMLLLERLFAHIQQHAGVRFQTLASVAEQFRADRPRLARAG